LDERLAEMGVEMIAPHRNDRKRTKHKTAENSGATNEGGKWSDSLPGYTTIEDARSGMNTKKKTSKPWCS
jgi:hypothetical protein